MTSNAQTAIPKQPQVPSVLLPEILGFSPQLLLDDVVNVANNAVMNTVDAMEQFLQRWADARGRAETTDDDWDSSQEIEHGLVAFQTLLEYHTDVAFDFFEAWSLRNIFAFAPDLPIVVPHQAGLDLGTTDETEQELIDDITSLREQINVHRELKRTFKRSLRISSSQLRRSKSELRSLSFLRESDLEFLDSLPEQYLAMYQACSSLPKLEPSESTSLSVVDPSRRAWETGKAGYMNWAAGLLVERVANRVTETENFDVNALRAAAKATSEVKNGRVPLRRANGAINDETVDSSVLYPSF